MKFFIANKEGRVIQSDDFENKQALIDDMISEGENPKEFSILTPREYRAAAAALQEIEIKNARKKQMAEDSALNEALSYVFPRTADEIAGTGEKPFITKSGSDDLYSLPGRTIGAVIDGILGNKSFPEDYLQSLGEARAEDRKRGTIGSVLQKILRDPLLIPGFATPVRYVPVAGRAIGSIGKDATTGIGKLLKGSIAKPAAEGAMAGAMVETARPFVTTEDEFDPEKIIEGIATGALLNIGLHNLGGAAKYGYSAAKNKYKNYKSKSEQANAIVENAAKNQGLSEYEIVERIVEENKALAKMAESKGVSIDDLLKSDIPPAAPPQKRDFDFWDYMKAESDYNAANAFDNMPLSVKARAIAERAGVNDNALKATLSPESVRMMADLHSEGRLGVGRRHLNELHSTEFKKGTDAKDIFMEEHGGDIVDPSAVKELGEIMKAFERDHTTGGTLSKHHKPAKDIIDEYAEKLLNPDGTPKEITLAEWGAIRNELGARKADFEGEVNLTGISREGKRFLDQVYAAFKKQEFEMLSPEAQAAHKSRAEFKRTHDDIIDNIAKNNVERAAQKYADIIANTSNDAIAKKEAVLDWLAQSDALRGTNFADEARHLSFSQNLTGNAPKDVPFHFPSYGSKYMTGKALAPDKLTVQEAVDLLRHYAGEDLNRSLNIIDDFPRLPPPAPKGGTIGDALPKLPPPAPKDGGGGAALNLPEVEVKGKGPGGVVYQNPNRKKKPTEAEIQAAVIDAISIGLEDEKDIREFVYSRLGSDYVRTDVLGVSTQKRGER